MIFATSKKIALLILAPMLTACFAPEAHAELATSKGLFLEQLASPASKLNTGLKYWILLKENGKLRSVNNLHLFKNGDKIRFKMLPNINGFVYVAMLEGSSGKAKLLFPLAEKNQGKVLAGRLYTIPEKGYFQFDNKPGVEKLRVVVSRQPQSQACLLQKKKEQKIVVIAQSAAPDSVIEYNKESTISAIGKADEKPLEFDTFPEGSANSVLEFSKDLNYVPPGVSQTKQRKRIRSTTIPLKLSKSKLTKKRNLTKSRRQVMAATPADSVTVINTNPELNLFAEIELKHIQ